MPTIIKKPNKRSKTNIFTRTPEGRPIEDVKITNKKILDKVKRNSKFKEHDWTLGTWPKTEMVTKAKFLASEVYITSAFINRLSKMTNRTIIVVPIVRTGSMYTTFIKKNKQVKIVPLVYPSTAELYTKTNEINLKTIIEDNKGSLFVFVDSSISNRMPAALTGHYTSQEDHLDYGKSIMGQLFKNNLQVHVANYAWGNGQKNVKQDYLTKYKPDQLNKIDAILLNPSIERNKLLSSNLEDDRNYNWHSAPHNDRAEYQTKDFQDIVLHFANQMKKSYSKIGKK